MAVIYGRGKEKRGQSPLGKRGMGWNTKGNLGCLSLLFPKIFCFWAERSLSTCDAVEAWTKYVEMEDLWRSV